MNGFDMLVQVIRVLFFVAGYLQVCFSYVVGE